MSTTIEIKTSHDTTPLRGVVEEAMERLHVPGVAVGIIHNGEEIVEGYGITNIDNPLAVDGETLFQIGSTTKTITGLIAMKLVEEGTLDLDEPIRTYLPSLRLSDPDVTARITMRHLFTHTGGFEGDYFADFGRGDDALEKIVTSLADLSQIAPLGEVWSYCNAGFYLAGRVIEVITGKPYETAARDMVLVPLGLTQSFFLPEEVMTYRFATGHDVQEDKVKVARPWQLPRVANPAGGLASSVRDNLRYARFLMGDGTAEDGTRLVKEETLRLMQSALVSAGPGTSVGITWYSREFDGIRLLSHGGGTNGQVSAFIYVPDRGFAIAVLTNASEGGMLQAVTEWALQRYLGVTAPKPEAREPRDGELARYAGEYEDLVKTITLTLTEGKLILELAMKPEAMAAVSDEMPPPPPPMPMAPCGEDRVLVLEGPYKDAEGEFIRKADGSIGWFRLGGRLHSRVS